MFDYPLLAALAAVIRTGSFEQAARELNVTSSAISQRVKLLEDRLGAVLVVRAHPCTATPAGLRLFRHAEDVGLLEHATRKDLANFLPIEKPTSVRLAVNADSLATWFIDAVAACDNMLFDLVLDDQDHSADWLRRGEVVAAVCSHSGPIQGCDSRALGALRYIASASPEFIAKWFPDGVTPAALQQAPAVSFNTKDMLQTEWIQRAFGCKLSFPSHRMPSTHAFADATLAGIGWGMNLEVLSAKHFEKGNLVPLIPDQPLDVYLYWQFSRMVASSIEDLTHSVRQAAQKGLMTGSLSDPAQAV
ncbi:LysR family transcriptional regulator ArgP [Pelagibius sp. Alg239-R121]|uniref:LysR family transcriptional regulator ArgP n=1 Tax=Pelagibius sp. Alg239-R121 TaxID=2993448 RepID=UPI0024A62B14|nr:LysR family transcriptional regulator ArgP [Pelagibius sp. Alg239-R121]